MADIAKVVLPNGDEYALKDVVARLLGTYYGVCSTAAATAAKTVTIDGITELTEGLKILVKFTNAQTYNGAPTLNVNGLGAKNIKRQGTTNAARYEWQAGELIELAYDGTYWLMLNGGQATTTYPGDVKLATSATSTSTSTALTPASLNSLVLNMIAGYPVYSTSATYNVGDRVRHGYQIWACNTAISTAEAWNEEHWTAISPLLDLIEAKYTKPSSGIPKTDLTAAVQASLGKADTALQTAPVTSVNGQTGAVTIDVPTAYTSNPAMDGTASPGTSNSWSKGDHVHPHDSSKQDVLVSGTNIKTVNGNSLLGSDDVTVQPTLVSGTNIKTINGQSVLGSGDLEIGSSIEPAVTIPVSDGVGAVGTSDKYAREDHQHPINGYELLIHATAAEDVLYWSFSKGDNNQRLDDYSELFIAFISAPNASGRWTRINVGTERANSYNFPIVYEFSQGITAASNSSVSTVELIKTPYGIFARNWCKSSNTGSMIYLLGYSSAKENVSVSNNSDNKSTNILNMFSYKHFNYVSLAGWETGVIGAGSQIMVLGRK